jgi:hypothetical protein
MSRLSRYRRGSLVPHLIALVLLLTAGIVGVGGDFESVSPYVAHAAMPARDGSDPARLETLDTIITPGRRTFLEPNFPNPAYENRTNIAFSLEREMTVTLRIYDFWYNEVATLYDNEVLAPDRYVELLTWGPGTTVQPLFSGMYFIELRADDQIHLRRMLVIK